MVAKGTENIESDTDLCAGFENNKFKNIAGVWNYLEEAFDKKVDFFIPIEI